MKLTITDAAQTKIKEFLKEDPSLSFRVMVTGGGCSGFQYALSLDEKTDKDTIINQNGFDVLVDPQSALYLDGINIDYVENVGGGGFKISNPQAKGHCGCGQSFSA